MIGMKYFYSLLITAMFALPGFAQQQKASDILDKTAENYRQAGGVKIEFEGSQEGKLFLMGNKFWFDTDEMEIWFDGKTQWSYLKQNEEVNITEPTLEELNTINPYALLSSYKQGYDLSYNGLVTRNGRQGYEINLTPQGKLEISYVSLVISKAYEPVYMGIFLKSGQSHQFIVRSCQTHQSLNGNLFRFDRRKYPDAEIIDMR